MTPQEQEIARLRMALVEVVQIHDGTESSSMRNARSLPARIARAALAVTAPTPPTEEARDV